LHQPAGAHIAGVGFLTGLYIAWAYIGFAIVEKFTYYFFDHQKVGWEYVSGAIIAFGVTAEICELIRWLYIGSLTYNVSSLLFLLWNHRYPRKLGKEGWPQV
jgi:hypothetical protein